MSLGTTRPLYVGMVLQTIPTKNKKAEKTIKIVLFCGLKLLILVSPFIYSLSNKFINAMDMQEFSMMLTQGIKTEFYPDRKKACIKVGRKCLPAMLRGLSDRYARITTHARIDEDQEVLVRVSCQERGSALNHFFIPGTIAVSALTENGFCYTLKIQPMDDGARSKIDHYLSLRTGTGVSRKMINRGIEAQTRLSLN